MSLADMMLVPCFSLCVGLCLCFGLVRCGRLVVIFWLLLRFRAVLCYRLAIIFLLSLRVRLVLLVRLAIVFWLFLRSKRVVCSTLLLLCVSNNPPGAKAPLSHRLPNPQTSTIPLPDLSPSHSYLPASSAFRYSSRLHQFFPCPLKQQNRTIAFERRICSSRHAPTENPYLMPLKDYPFNPIRTSATFARWGCSVLFEKEDLLGSVRVVEEMFNPVEFERHDVVGGLTFLGEELP